MFQENELIISVGGKKANVLDALPQEALAMLAMLQQKPTAHTSLNLHGGLNKESMDMLLSIQKEEIRHQVTETSPDLSNIVKEAFKEANQVQGLVRSAPEEIRSLNEKQFAIELLKTEQDPIKKLTIFEFGVALGITVGQTTKKEVIELMKNHSKLFFTENDYLHEYTDTSISVFFNDDGLVSEMKFMERYKGKTSKGLAIGDLVDKAIQIYGQPKMKSPKGAIWKGFAVFSERNVITSIRVQK